MDKEKAKWLLASYRPDGSDAEDPLFAEALALVLKDQELGEWLAAERAADVAFARGLGSVEVEPLLKDRLTRVLMGDQPEDNDQLAEMDHALMEGLGTIEVPTDLRDRILISAGASEEAVVTNKPGVWRKSRSILAIAAALAVGFWVVIGLQQDIESGNAGTVAAAEVMNAYQGPSQLEFRSGEFASIQAFLKEQKAMVPYMLGPGFKGMKSIGCAEIEIKGQTASLVCFKETKSGKVLHLIVFKKDVLEGDMGDVEHPVLEATGQMASARWRCPKCDYLLIAHELTADQLGEMLS